MSAAIPPVGQSRDEDSTRERRAIAQGHRHRHLSTSPSILSRASAEKEQIITKPEHPLFLHNYVLNVRQR